LAGEELGEPVGSIHVLSRDALRATTVDADELPLVIAGGGLRGGVATSGGDHRLAMAFAVGALAGDRPSEVAGMEAAAVSFPDFVGTLRSLGAAIEVIG
jgi:3-phosphoshikimate 1-carboxyvinyltransferase